MRYSSSAIGSRRFPDAVENSLGEPSTHPKGCPFEAFFIATATATLAAFAGSAEIAGHSGTTRTMKEELATTKIDAPLLNDAD